MLATNAAGVRLLKTVIVKTAIVATVGIVAASMLSPGLIIAGERDGPSLAQALVQNPGRRRDPNVKVISPMSRCMATWDSSTQMSKQEWRTTCKRTVRENPGLYNKPF
jgi:hypothetical protein